MKPKPLVATLIVILVCGLGVAALLRSHRAARPDADDDDNDDVTTSPVVAVQVGALKRATLHQYVTGYGTVMPAPATTSAPAADAVLAAPTAGTVATVDVVEGQSVANGDLVATFNSSTITADYARTEAERLRTLYEQHNASLKSLQDAETQVALLRVTAPLAGTVTRVAVRTGSAVDQATVVAEIMDLNRLVVVAAIPEADAPALAIGQTVQILIQPAVTATVDFVGLTVNPADGTVQARAALPAAAGLRPGTLVPLRIVTAVRADCLAAPEASVVTDIDGRSVIALVRGDRAVVTPVRTGLREGGWVQVDAPELKAGDAVVTVGAYGLPDQARLQVVNPSGGPAPAEAAPATSRQ